LNEYRLKGRRRERGKEGEFTGERDILRLSGSFNE